MILTTRVFTRPSTSVQWWNEHNPTASADFYNRLLHDFIDTHKIVLRTVTPTDLTITVVIAWVDQASADTHYNDSQNIAYFKQRDDYNKSVGITDTFTSVTK